MSTSGMFTRLRAKLTSQQISTKEVSALAEREEEANKKALNQSISDAVLEAVRNEEFIKAVAVQLASELQPSFQELGPSAYNDRLQAHIEILKKRFDVQDTKLTHLSTILESNNLSTAEKICRIEEASNSISKYQGELSESTKVAEENQNAQLLSLGTQMELVQEKILILSESLSDKVESIKSQMMAETTASLSEINLNLKNISKTLEEQSTKLVEIKDVASSPEVLARIDASNELNTTQVAALSELKSLTEKSFNEFSNVHSNSSAISSTLDSNISKIDDIKNLLTDITNSETNQEILAETKASNESLVIVTNTLSELKSGQSEILPSISISNDAIKSLCRDLEDIKKTESSLTENFKMASLNTSAQSEVIEDVKSFLTNNVATIAGIATIEQSVDTLKSSTDNMNALLDDLKITVSRPQPIAEKVDLSKLESSLETITTEISQIKAANETLLGETHLAPLLSTLDAQSTKLMEIKSTVLASVQSTDKFDLSSIESSVKDLSSMLESQISSLGDLKKSVAALENTQKTDISGLESLIQKIDISGLESLIQKIDISGLESLIQKIDLSGLESSIQKIDLSRLETSIQKIDISSLESSIQKVIQTLESQKEALANSNTPTDS